MQRPMFSFLSLMLINALLGSSAQATPGDLDTTFSSDGIAFVTNHSEENGFDVIAANTKPIFVGVADDQFAIGKLTSSGSLDTTFAGGTGLSTFELCAYTNSFQAVTTDSSGKIIAVGNSECFYDAETDTIEWGDSLIIYRFTSNGDLDTTFGTDGLVSINDDNIDTLFDVAIDSTGKIVVTGYGAESLGFLDFCLTTDSTYCEVVAGSSDWQSYYQTNFQTDAVVLRLTSSGAIDTTFGGGDGKVVFDIGGELDTPTSIAVTSSNQVLISGWTKADMFSDDADFFVARLTSTGNVSTSFGTSGITITNIGTNIYYNNYNDEAYGMDLTSSGKIIITGCSELGTNDIYGTEKVDISLVKYTSSGDLDTTFGGGDGIVKTSINTIDCARDVKVQSITVPSAATYYVVGGYTVESGYSEFALLRYDESGSLDTGFGGGDGIVTHGYGSNHDEKANSVTIDSNNKIVLGGQYCASSTCYFMISRYKSVF